MYMYSPPTSAPGAALHPIQHVYQPQLQPPIQITRTATSSAPADGPSGSRPASAADADGDKGPVLQASLRSTRQNNAPVTPAIDPSLEEVSGAKNGAAASKGALKAAAVNSDGKPNVTVQTASNSQNDDNISVHSEDAEGAEEDVMSPVAGEQGADSLANAPPAAAAPPMAPVMTEDGPMLNPAELLTQVRAA